MEVSSTKENKSGDDPMNEANVADTSKSSWVPQFNIKESRVQ